MSIPLVIIGGGGFARESLDVMKAVNEASSHAVFDLLGVIDDSLSEIGLKRLRDLQCAYLGTLAEWLQTGTEAHYTVAIGNPVARRKVCESIQKEPNLRAVSLLHPNAVIGSGSTIGDGSVVCSGVQISTNVRLGAHVHANPGAIIGHDAQLADFVSINPGAIVSGETDIGEMALIGAGAVLLQGLSVGSGSTVGAGGVVTKDVGSDLIVKGVPAR